MRLKVASHRPEPDVIRRAVASLGSGGVIAYPTETFYGLAASAFDFEGCRRVFEIKGRRRSHALPLILANTSQLADVAAVPSALMQCLAEKFWPGPLTLVVEALPGVAAASDDGTVALRISSQAVARALALAAGPVTSTSANVSGSPPAITAEEVEAGLSELVDLVLDGGATSGGRASTIVDITGSTPKLVREGRVGFADVLSLLENDGK